MVIPISQASREYADSVRKAIRKCHFFVDVDHGDNKMEKKIRDAQLEQYNYILVSFLIFRLYSGLFNKTLYLGQLWHSKLVRIMTARPDANNESQLPDKMQQS